MQPAIHRLCQKRCYTQHIAGIIISKKNYYINNKIVK